MIRLPLAGVALLLSLAACGQKTGSGECSAEQCEAAPPPPRCSDDGDAVVASTAFIECDGETCVFQETRTPCPDGCSEGACLPPCAGVVCVEPLEPTCSGNVLVERTYPGTAQGSDCSCEYETRRTPCGDDVCFDGECRPFECAFLTCDSPPDPVCTGTVLRTFGVGACVEATRSCDYPPTDRDCADDGLICRNGACEVGCRDETCTSPPPPRCEGNIALEFPSTGRCSGQTCNYGEPTRIDCGEQDAVCRGGACVPLCTDDTCVVPPPDTCDGNVAVQNAATGRCDGPACVYEQTRVDCTLDGQACVRGRCTTDPTCEGVVCNRPPAGTCEGGVAVQSEARGFCTVGGVCNYGEVRRDCAAAGAVCADGECVDFCDANVCVTPPEDFCDGAVAVIHPGFGDCDSAERSCSYVPFRVDCDALDQRCVAGACVGGCIADDCDEPPTERFCIDSRVAGYESIGFCRGDQTCGYDPVVIRNCADSGDICRAGECLSLCGGEYCTEPPDATCDGDVRVGFGEVGLCVGGRCAYNEERTNCRADGLGCVDGECVDLCETLSCTVRPDPFCDGDVLVVSTFPAACEDSECRFEQSRFDCATIGDVCVAGACVDPCAGIVCNRPDANTCDGDAALRYRPTGLCERGTCRYVADRVDCSTFGASCLTGSCIDRCIGVVCDDVPDDGCYGTELYEYSGESVCTAGDCFYFADSYVDCSDTGLLCDDDLRACFDPCDRLTCDAPAPAACDEDVLTAELAPGTCDDGACTYLADTDDCQQLGAICDDGRCVDSCDGVDCGPLPARACEGNIAVEFTASPPVCVAGECLRDASRTDCLATGRNCAGGQCVTVADPCVTVTCPATTAATCEGDVVVERLAPGVCVAGPPTRCEYGAFESRTVCGDGFGCWNGACRRVPEAGELVITEIMFDPLGSDLDREWVEVFNTADAPLLLGGVTLRTANGEYIVDEDVSIAASAHLALAAAGAGVAGAVTYPYFAAPIRNDRDAVELRRGPWIIDRVAFDVAVWPSSVGRTLSLAPARRDADANDDPRAWCTGSASGSPGASNPACP